MAMAIMVGAGTVMRKVAYTRWGDVRMVWWAGGNSVRVCAQA